MACTSDSENLPLPFSPSLQMATVGWRQRGAQSSRGAGAAGPWAAPRLALCLPAGPKPAGWRAALHRLDAFPRLRSRLAAALLAVTPLLGPAPLGPQRHSSSSAHLPADLRSSSDLRSLSILILVITTLLGSMPTFTVAPAGGGTTTTRRHKRRA